MKTLVKRKSPDYHKKRLNELTELDRIACYLLAANWSKRYIGSYIYQQFIQMNCVAACYVYDELWVASNDQSLTYDDIQTMLNELGQNMTVYIVTNGTKNVMHAEMQLLSELIQERKNLYGQYFGVSKPCCKRCKEELDKYGINYTHYHTSEVVNWQPPI